MKDYTFKIPQEIIFGPGVLNRLPELLKKSGSEKTMIVSDHGLEKVGVVKQVMDLAEENGIKAYAFLDIQPNPTVEMRWRVPSIRSM